MIARIESPDHFEEGGSRLAGLLKLTAVLQHRRSITEHVRENRMIAGIEPAHHAQGFIRQLLTLLELPFVPQHVFVQQHVGKLVLAVRHRRMAAREYRAQDLQRLPQQLLRLGEVLERCSERTQSDETGSQIGVRCVIQPPCDRDRLAQPPLAAFEISAAFQRAPQAHERHDEGGAVGFHPPQHRETSLDEIPRIREIAELIA